MTNLQKELDRAFSLLSSIPVSGDGVELMAATREHLRRAFKITQEQWKSEEEEANGDS